ncbi:hypothetical protein QL285_056888 [Trifolium repens]|nr:hypothetical protein QL285_056888 [Trifolium repens]
MAGGVRSFLLHTTTFPTFLSGELSLISSSIAEFFGPLRSVPLRTRNLMVVVVDLDFGGSDLVVVVAGLFGGVVFPAGMVVRRGSRSFCAVLMFWW